MHSMDKNTILIIMGLTVMWIILLEGFTVVNLALGIIISAGCIYICHRLLPLPKMIKNINLFRFILYPFYLTGQVYLAAFNAMKLIFTGANVSVIQIRTQISNSFLRTILANSITLTPGSVSLELNDTIITILWLKKKTENHQDAEKAGELIKQKLEKMLIKAEK